MPLLDAAEQKHEFSCGSITTQAPDDPSSWILSYGNLDGLPERPTSLLLHSWDDAGWRYINRAYNHMRGMQIAGVSQKVLDRYSDWIKQGEHTVAGVLPPPVTEFTNVKGKRNPRQIVVAWMGRPLESKGLLSLPYLLKRDPRIVARVWTGAETAGLEYTQRVQSQMLDRVINLAQKLGVYSRLDIRPLDFDPFSYRKRLEGAHVLLGNSKCEGFLLTAAEALSCGIPVVVTRQCGVADYIRKGVNGYMIDWDSNPRRLARDAHHQILKAIKLDPMNCLRSVQDLSTSANYKQAFANTLAKLTHTQLQNPDARVTVGVRIHKGTNTECLDDAINSIANQTYRRFKVVLLADGPWSYGEALAKRYNLPLICTGMEPDITQCSWLHRQAVEQCDTEFYKPLDYDDQMLPGYLERAVATMDERNVDMYGCMLMTLESGEIKPRLHWPNKPIETMFTGNSDDNMLPHSSTLMRTEICRKAGNYQERAVGLGADDYHLWYRIHQVGGRFYRDDDVRNIVYRIHDKNSLKIRRERYGHSNKRKLITGAAAAASFALIAGQSIDTASAKSTDDTSQVVDGSATTPPVDPPHS